MRTSTPRIWPPGGTPPRGVVKSTRPRGGGVVTLRGERPTPPRPPGKGWGELPTDARPPWGWPRGDPGGGFHPCGDARARRHACAAASPRGSRRRLAIPAGMCLVWIVRGNYTATPYHPRVGAFHHAIQAQAQKSPAVDRGRPRGCGALAARRGYGMNRGVDGSE